MGMREHEKGNARDAEIRQASIHQHRVGTRVDHHGFALGGTQHERIALPHVAGHHDPVLRRPARPIGQAQRERGHDSDHDGDERDDAWLERPLMTATLPPDHPDESTCGDESKRGAAQSARPRQRGSGQSGGMLGHRGDPCRGRLGTARQQVRDRRADRRDNGGEEPEDGDGNHRWRGEQIGGNGNQADALPERRDERQGRDLRRDRHRQCVGKVTPDIAAAAHPGHESGCERKQPGGSGDRQGKPPRHRKTGRPGQQDDDTAGQRGNAVTSTSREHGGESHHAHRRRTQHAGLRSDDNDEHGEGGECQHHTSDQSDAHQGRHHENRADHDRGVAA